MVCFKLILLFPILSGLLLVLIDYLNFFWIFDIPNKMMASPLVFVASPLNQSNMFIKTERIKIEIAIAIAF